MINKFIGILYFIILIVFLLFSGFYYFSNENKNKILKNRINLSNNISESIKNIPFLENDTDNIILYPSSNSKDEELKKRYFWELLN